MFQAKKLTDNIFWVGAVDYNVRSFHGYSTDRGATYNAYLVLDKKVTLIDSVKASFTDEMLQRISSVIDPAKIDVVISNHAEFDHSGAIKAVYELSNAKVYATAAGVKTLTTLYGEMDYVAVKPGETLNTGKYTFSFLPTPMVHWPDNMVTYLPSEQILFSNDAFGQHIATSTRLDVETDVHNVMHEAKKYYANIVMPYAAQVSKALSAAQSLKLKMIAPSHGVVLTKLIPNVFDMYTALTQNKKDGGALVVYDSMWGGTEKMALHVGAAFEKVCSSVKYFDLKHNHISDILTHLSTAEYLAVGSPTLNNTTLPTVAAFLNYTKGLRPQGLKYVAFGTFGWAGGAVKEICGILDALGHEKIAEYTQNFVPATLDFPEIDSLKK